MTTRCIVVEQASDQETYLGRGDFNRKCALLPVLCSPGTVENYIKFYFMFLLLKIWQSGSYLILNKMLYVLPEGVKSKVNKICFIQGECV